MEKKELEDLFKKSFENYEAEVSPGVWKNVRIGLKWGGLALLFSTFLNKIGTGTIIAILSSAALISTVAVMNKESNVSEKTSLTAFETKIIPGTAVQKPVSAAENTAEFNTNEQKSENKIFPTVQASSNTSRETTKKDNKTGIVPDKLSEEPVASILASSVSGMAPLIVNLSNNGTGKKNSWTFGDGAKDKSTSNPVHVFEVPGIYSIILTSKNDKGIMATDSIKVEVKANSSTGAVPMNFSPNGDGVLDVFVFQTKNIAKMNARIFDKKGTLVYKSESTDAKWDGKDLQGKEAKEGVYYFIIEAEGIDGKKYEPQGSINLTR